MPITANVSPIYDYKRGFIVVTWPNIPNGNQGDPFEVSGFLLGSVDWQGTIGAGFSARLEGTDNPNGAPAVWGAIPNWTTTVAGLLVPSADTYPVFVRFVRPNITAGDGTTSMTARLLLVTQCPS
jgi:hypothetical protein